MFSWLISVGGVWVRLVVCNCDLIDVVNLGFVLQGVDM